MLLTLSPSFSSCSEEEPEGTLPKDKLITLCKYEPILKWMRSCDHILYQALVEILIPDVLRPVPSEYPQPHLSLISLWLPLATKISTVQTHVEVFVLAEISSAVFLLQHCPGGMFCTPWEFPCLLHLVGLHFTSPDFGQESGEKHSLDMGALWDVAPWRSLFAQDHPDCTPGN